jgi:hypothetical protein
LATQKLVGLATILGLTCLSAGCAATSEIVATEVLNYSRCEELKRGVHQISFAQLPAVRGVRLLRDPSQPVQSSAQDYPSDAVMIAVFNGRQPTPGYAFVFTGARQIGKEIRLDYTWQTPAPGSVQAAVVTSPCSVMQLRPIKKDTTVSAWLDQASLGTITVQWNAENP